MILQGQKVFLRAYQAGVTDEELERIYRWSRDEDLLHLSGGTVHNRSLSQFKREFLRRLNQRNSRESHFLIFTHEGELIGRMACVGINYRRKEGELGIVIGERAYWGQGYGTDAILALLNHLFATTDLDRIYLHTYPHNMRAQRCFEKCGFRRVESRRRLSLFWGYQEEIEMEVFRSRFVDTQRQVVRAKDYAMHDM